MNITAENYKINLTHDELWLIAFELRRSQESILKTHYVHHQKAWEENEKSKIIIIKDLFYNLGRPDLYEDLFKIRDDIYKEFNEKKII